MIPSAKIASINENACDFRSLLPDFDEKSEKTPKPMLLIQEQVTVKEHSLP